jgi:hypothetical protein
MQYRQWQWTPSIVESTLNLPMKSMNERKLTLRGSQCRRWASQFDSDSRLRIRASASFGL